MILLSFFWYSSLLIRAVTFLAPSFFARAAETMLMSCSESGLTAMKRSALPVPAWTRVSMEVGRPTTVTMSESLARSSRLSGSGEITVISWYSMLSILARWLPISPAPATMILIELSVC